MIKISAGVEWRSGRRCRRPGWSC